MPSFDPALPVTKTTDLTKKLRSRDAGVTLLSLLPIAEDLLLNDTTTTTTTSASSITPSDETCTTTNIHFPRKEEWLLEWTVQRLREDTDSSPEAPYTNSRLSCRFWRFLLVLLQRMDGVTSARGLRKHGFLQLVEKTLGDCTAVKAGEEWVVAAGSGSKRDVEGDVSMGGDDVTDSSVTESGSGSPRDGGDGGRSRKRRRMMGLEQEGGKESLGCLLGEMAKVVKFLQDTAAGKVGLDTKVSGSIIPVFRGTPEVGGQILGGYLHNLLRVTGDKEEAVNGIEAMIGVWRGCVYGNGDLKKTSTAFSKTCLLPVFEVLATDISRSENSDTLEKLVAEYIFTPALLAASSTVPKSKFGVSTKHSASQAINEALQTELKTLLEPLKGIPKSAETRDVGLGLNNLLRIAIGKSSQFSGSETVEAILEVLLSVILDVRIRGGDAATSSSDSLFPERDAEIIASMLNLINNAGLSISDDILRNIVTLAANLPFNRGEAPEVRWTIIELALTLDFDTFVMSQSTSLLGRLVSALSDSWVAQAASRDALLRVVTLLLNGFLRARDLDGFLSFWLNELNDLYTIGGEKLALSSIWTSENVVASVSNVIERGYSAPRIEKLTTSYLDSLIQLGGSGGLAFAKMFLLDTLLRGVRREETEERLKNGGTLLKIFDMATEIETPASAVVIRQLIFRVVQLDSTLIQAEKYGKVLSGSLELLKEEVNLPMKKSSKKWTSTSPTKFAELLFCLEVLLHHMDTTKVVNSEVGTVINTILQNGVAYIQSKAAADAEENWNGEIFVGLNWAKFAVVVLFAITKKWLSVLAQIETASPSVYFDSFVTLVHISIRSAATTGLSARKVWYDMLNSTIIYELPILRDQCLNAIISSKAVPHDNTWYNLYLETIAKFPLEAIRMDLREQTKDSIFILNFTTSLNAPDSEKLALARRERSLLARLMDTARTNSGPISDPKKLVEWFGKLDNTIEDDSRQGKATIATAKKILHRAMVDVEQQHNSAYLVKLAKELYSTISKTKQVSSTWTLALCFLRECWGCTVEEVKEESINLRSKVIAKATKWLEKSTEAKLTAQLLPIYAEAVFLDQGAGNAELALQAQKRCAKLLEQWLPVWAKSRESATLEEQAHFQDILVGLVGLRCQCPQSVGTIEPTIAFVIFALEYSPELASHKASVLDHFTRMASRLPSKAFSKAITSISESCFPITKEVGQDYFLLLQILLKGTKKEPNAGEATAESNANNIHDTIAKIYSSICLALPKSTTQETFLTLLDCLGTILKDLPWAIIQFSIDETLSALTICASPSGPTFTPSASASTASTETPADGIYIPITRILLAILLGHRVRLKGRYHLLITLLQSLLRPLFTTPSHLLKKSDSQIHPPWLHSPLALSSASSRAYTRLLTTLCDPPASTVSSKKNTPTSTMLLTSHTNLARKEVARYIPYVMMEFIHLQLNRNGGRMVMEKGVREALTQGVYAMFEVMKAEEGTLKIVSAGLDAQGRVLFKRMWEEFGKFGVEK